MNNYKITYIKNAQKIYPQWTVKNTVLRLTKFALFRNKIKHQGYEIKAANIAYRDGKLYWILENYKTGEMYLEQYATTN